MVNRPIEYKSFVIQLRGDGFRHAPNVAGKIASFWVVKKEPQIRSIFAFTTSMLDAFVIDEEDSEEKILESAIMLIKQYIDESKIKDLEEYPFEYKTHQFFLNKNANWWSKSLKTFFPNP